MMKIIEIKINLIKFQIKLIIILQILYKLI